MAFIRHIAKQFNLVYLKPSIVVRAVRELTPAVKHHQGQQRRQYEDRRCGLDRRQKNRHVLVNMRSSYSRRVQSSRRDREGNPLAIDVYA